MALGDISRLIATLELQDKFSQTATRANQQLTTLERTTTRAGTRMGGLSRLSTGAGAAMGTFGGRVKQVGGALGAVAGVGGLLGLATGFTKAISASRDFDEAMLKIVGLTDVAEGEIDGIRTSILSLSGEVGKAPQELADAFYFLASAGLDTKQALEVLATSAKASATGLGETQDVAKTIGAVINAYGKENITAAAATDTLVTAVKDGTAEASDFANVLQYVIPTAAAMKVPFDEATAAIAAMTLGGTSAETAATNLNNVLSSLLKPTAGATAVLKDMGTSSEELRQEIKDKGLLFTLEDLRQKFGGNEAAMAKVFGNIRSLRGVMGLLNLDADQLAKVFGDTASATGALNTAFEETEGPGRKMDRAFASIQATFITLGDVWLPKLADGLSTLGTWLNTHQSEVKDFAQGALDLVVGLGTIVGGVVSAVQTAWGAVPDPLKDLLIKGFVADRTIKFLFGFSPAKLVVSGVESAFAHVAGQFAANKLVPQNIVATQPIPVFVTNPGFGGPGGVGAPIAGAGGSILTRALGFAGFVGLLFGAGITLAQIERAIEPGVVEAKEAFDRNRQEGLAGFFGAQKPIVGAATPAGQFDRRNPGGVPVKIVNSDEVQEWDERNFNQAAANSRRIEAQLVNLTLEQRLLRDKNFKPKLDASEFLRILRRTSEFGEKGVGTTIEQGPRTGRDPTGQVFLSLVRRLSADALKDAGVQREIRNHIIAAEQVQRRALREGDKVAAAKLQQTINALHRLNGTVDRTLPKLDQVGRHGRETAERTRDAVRHMTSISQISQRTRDHMATLLGIEQGVRSNTAGFLKKDLSPNIDITVPVTTNVSVSDIVRAASTYNVATSLSSQTRTGFRP